MSGHTPGPWRLKRNHSGEEFGAVLGRDGDLVATTGYQVRVGSNEDDANARLIAAAPELFETLGAIVHWHDEADSIDESWWQAARDVIAKVTQ